MRKSNSGTLSFGVMGIGVAFHNAASEKRVTFKTLTKNGNTVKRQYVDAVTGEIVNEDDCNKGYVTKKGHYKTGDGAEYAVFTREEVEALEAEASKTIDIRAFVPAEDVPAEYYAKTYYLTPESGWESQYALFAAGLQRSGYSAMASWTSSGKEHAVLVTADEDEDHPALKLHLLYNANEVNAFVKEFARVELDNEDVDMVVTLIQRKAKKAFDPTVLRDRFAERVMMEVEKKQTDPKYRVAIKAGGTAAAPAQDNKALLKQMLAAAAADDAKAAGQATVVAAAAPKLYPRSRARRQAG